jgi:vacuolar-type H+-ATPase subunit F/Vma7
MSRIVALGAAARVAGYVLAGVTVLETDEDGPLAAWDRLPDDTGLVVLTPDAADALAERLTHDDRLLWTVLPT